MKKDKAVDRKHFLKWTAGISAVVAIPSLFHFFRKNKPSTSSTTKMLTQDGKLVEIDITKLPVKKSKISDEGIHTWIKTDPQKM